MSEKNLGIYLNDHLAGSTAALELLDRLEKSQPGTDRGKVLAGIRSEVAADRAELEALMGKLHVAKSRSRGATAWLAEKLTRLKLRPGDSISGALGLLEAIEAVALGIHGKLALWRALAAAAEVAPGLQVADFDRLARRAEDQRRKIEKVRLQVAKQALG
jgi:hypothetical protein